MYLCLNSVALYFYIRQMIIIVKDTLRAMLLEKIPRQSRTNTAAADRIGLHSCTKPRINNKQFFSLILLLLLNLQTHIRTSMLYFFSYWDARKEKEIILLKMIKHKVDSAVVMNERERT